MQRSGSRFLPLIISLIVIVAIIFGIVSLGNALFNGSKNTSTDTPDNSRQTLLSTSLDHSVRMTTRGPIVAQEDFKSYSITVSPVSRDMTLYSGYLDEVEKQKDLHNNTRAYEQFVYALDKANMMKGTQPSDDASNDLRGICASGYVYEYSILVDDKVTKRLWASTCNGSKGTLDASVEQLNGLFFAQIPGYQNLIPFKENSLILHY